MARTLPSVVLVGRPNVGKSTLFNRLTGTRRAIVTAMAGTTRDVLAQPAEWQGATFELIDTGGMFGASEDPLHALVLERGRRAIGAADVLVLVVDGRDGLVPSDREIARVIRQADTPALVAINKVDDKRAKAGANEFFQLGFDQILEISAEHGRGIGELLDAIGYNKLILECGCGTGQLTQFLQLNNNHTLGVDLSLSSLGLGVEHKSRNELERSAFAQMNIFDLAVKDDDSITHTTEL